MVGPPLREQEQLIEELDGVLEFIRNVVRTDLSRLIFWATYDPKKKRKGLKFFNSPKAINKILNRLLFNHEWVLNPVPVVLTSATLCQDGTSLEEKYGYQIKTLGYEGEFSDPKVSPFDYDNNASLYIPNDIIPPSKEHHEEFLDQITSRIIDLCHITNGRSMVLFTAKADLGYVYKAIRKTNIPWKVLKQIDSSTQNQTIEEFRRTKGILLATRIFWEGINISGPDLSQVIIPRLPLPVPDPILEYKSSLTGAPMRDVYVPEMIIKLRQGVGRLIRDKNDVGLVSILDSRLSDSTKYQWPYRSPVLNTLAIKNIITSLNEARQFAIEKGISQDLGIRITG